MKKYNHILAIAFAFAITFSSCDDAGDSSNDIAPSRINGGEVPAGQAGSLARFGILEDRLMTVDWNTLKNFDISDPRNPSYLSNTQLGWGIETIFIRSYDSTIFIGTQNGMQIYDGANMNNPIHLSTYQHIFACDPVVANDKWAFVTLRSDADWGCARAVDQIGSSRHHGFEKSEKQNDLPHDQS